MGRLGRALVAATIMVSVFAPTASGEQLTGLTSGPLEYLETIPFDAGTAWGGRIVDDYFYVGSYKQFTIYDVSDPINPVLISTTPLVGQGLTMEDIDTNGEILLLTADTQVGSETQVWDVEDKSAPMKIATVPGTGDHTMTCVLDCKWAYGSAPSKSIIDLRDPADPKLVGSWKYLGVDYVHDVTEVAPGRIVASTDPMMYIDARRPADPKTVAYASMKPKAGIPTQQRLIGTNRWPRSGNDKFLLVSEESPFSGQCSAESASFKTFDARKWRAKNRLVNTGTYQVRNGTYTDGNPPANAVGCSALYFQQHPDFRNGGMVAASFAEHGMRLLDVASSGTIEELGYYVPYGGSVSAAYWASEEIVYSVDLTRGFDILRVNR